MEWINVLLTLVTGVFLRIALPFAVTILLVLWLRWLDARWQQDAEQYQTMAVAPPAQRCWNIMGCPPERREACQAYRNPDIPCWQAFRGPNGQMREACLLCRVFREAPVPLAA